MDTDINRHTLTSLMCPGCKVKHTVKCLLPSAGTFCNRTWDGWLCWGDTSPGTVMQMCPEYFHDFDPAGEALTRTLTHISTTFNHMAAPVNDFKLALHVQY